MSNLSIVVDEKRCINCHACEIHCQVWNRTSAMVKPGQLLNFPPRTEPQRTVSGRLSESASGEEILPAGLMPAPPIMRTAFLSCMHCDDPPCVRVCPTEAMRRRARDGIVYVETGLCVGCQACIMACPWRVPQWCPQDEVIAKCDMCRERLDKALKPACVTGCTAQALVFSDDPAVAEGQRRRREQALKNKGNGEER